MPDKTFYTNKSHQKIQKSLIQNKSNPIQSIHNPHNPITKIKTESHPSQSQIFNYKL